MMMTVLEALNVQRTHKLRVEDFFLLQESGALDSIAKTELIDGEIIAMNAQFMPHARAKMAIYNALRDAVGSAGLPLSLFTEATVAMPPHNAPEPDVLLVEDPGGPGAFPAESVKLLVEVADTTVRNDLIRKSRLYAGYGIAEYWVVDLDARTVHQLWQPSGAGYAKSKRVAFGAEIVAETLDGVAVATAALG